MAIEYRDKRVSINIDSIYFNGQLCDTVRVNDEYDLIHPPFSYTFSDDNKYVVLGPYGDVEGEVEIPATYAGKSVYAIGGYQGMDVTKVTCLDSGVVAMDYGFTDCARLLEVSGVAYAGRYAFQGCSSLRTFSSELYGLGESAFEGCRSLTEICLSKLVGAIPYNCFKDCGSLRTVYFSGTEYEWSQMDIADGNAVLNNATIIYHNHSYDYTTITEPTCTTGGQSLKRCDCGAEEYVTWNALGHDWPDDWVITVAPTCTTDGKKKRTCKRDGCNAFEESGEGLEAYGHDHSGEWFYGPPPTCDSPGVRFNFCKNCHGDGMSESVPALGHKMGAFKTIKEPTYTEPGVKRSECQREGCDYYELKSIQALESVFEFTQLNDGNYSVKARNGAVVTGDIEIPSSVSGGNVTEIAKDGFSGRTITSVVIPGSVITIGENAFKGCANLESVIIGEGTTTIGRRAFYSCDSLTSIVIPASITSIDDYAFMHAEKILSVFYGDLYSVKYDTISFSNITANPLKSNKDTVLYLYSEIDPKIDLKIDGNFWRYVNKVPRAWCRLSEDHEMGESIVDKQPDCSNKGHQYWECKKCGYIEEEELDYKHDFGDEWHIEKSATTVSDGLKYQICTECGAHSASVSFVKPVDFANPTPYADEDGDGEDDLFKLTKSRPGEQTKTWAILHRRADEVIPDPGIYPDEMFPSFPHVSPIQVPNELVLPTYAPDKYPIMHIGASGFAYAKYKYDSLTVRPFRVGIPYLITTIDRNAFEGSMVEAVVIEDTEEHPSQIKYIDFAAFRNCVYLQRINFPKSVKWICSNAFDGCTKLKNVTIPYGVTRIESGAFSNLASGSTIYVAEPEKPALWANDWCDEASTRVVWGYNVNYDNFAFEEIKDDYGQVKAFSVRAINTSLEGDIHIPSQYLGVPVTHIAAGGFAGCEKITSVKIESGIYNIGEGAFAHCPNLVKVATPNTILHIEAFAFNDCKNLKCLIIGDSIKSIGAYALPDLGRKYIYYHGDASKWAKVQISSYGNSVATNKIYFYSLDEPTGTLNYWHYVDSEAVVWGYTEDTNVYLVTESGEFLTDEQDNLLIL